MGLQDFVDSSLICFKIEAEDGMFGHPTWNAFALVIPSGRFL